MDKSIDHAHTIIGMAGHIDHGKTELIKALTGLETDQLKEEKERGITIDLGFAYWKDNVTIIDVPGHEKFIRNMVTGVNAVDFFLLVIAADDGIMPQTREHFEILNFFGVKNGIIAVNKIDLVDEEWKDLILNDIHDFLKENSFVNIPVIPVSAKTGIGIDRLREEIFSKIEQVEPRSDQYPFRLNIDRSFTLKGHGTVITGTVLSAMIKVGDPIQILPDNIDAKVRAIQVHKRNVDSVYIGQRAAINISSVTPEESRRGKVIVKPDTLVPAFTLLTLIKTVNKLPFSIKKHSIVHIHLGTFETIGKITWYHEDKELKEKQSYVVFIKLNDKTAVAPDDPVLFRSFSPVTTIAGGRVLQINPPKITKNQQIREEYFSTLINGTLAEKIMTIIEFYPFRYFSAVDLVKMLFVNKDNIIKVLEKLLKNKKLIYRDNQNTKIYLSLEKINSLNKIIYKLINENLAANKFKQGFNSKELLNLLKKYRVTEKYLEIALQIGVNQKIFVINGELYMTKDAVNNKKDDEIFKKVADMYFQTQYTPPTLLSLAQTLKLQEQEIKDICTELNKQNLLISISGQFYLHMDKFKELIEFIRDLFKREETLKISDVRTFTNSSRKYIIPIMEYLDSKNYTRRLEEDRVKGEKL